ncbi:MAG: hypothetical protein ACRDV3_13385 [Acidothermaceae bacterium]
MLQRTLTSFDGWYRIIVDTVAVVMAVWMRKGMRGRAERFGLRLFPAGYLRTDESN